MRFVVCYINVHKRCQSNVANNCGINTGQLAEILNEMGMTAHTLSSRSKAQQQQGRPKVVIDGDRNFLRYELLVKYYFS